MNPSSCNSAQTALLVLPQEGVAIPVSTCAFYAAQSSRRALQKYIGGILIYRSGETRRIEKISVNGPLGKSFWRKILSILTSAWSISTQVTDPLNLGLDDIKQLVADNLINSNVYLDVENLQAPDMKAAIFQASNVGEIFDLLQMPAPDDALDVL